jgi:chromosomal replication initiator protein
MNAEILDMEMSAAALDGKWKRVQARLRASVGEKVYSSWFTRLKVERLEGNVLVLSLPTRFLRNWIESHYLDKLSTLWHEEIEQITNIELFVRQYGHSREQKTKPETGSVQTGIIPDTGQRAAETIQDGSWRAILKQGNGNGFNRDMTFATYVVGKSNELSCIAARRAVSDGRSGSVGFNPLYIHGSVGVGKTHLLNAIAGEIYNQAPDLNVLFLSAERFMFSFVAALKARDTLAFKSYLREVDVLLIDDMQFLRGPTVQREFCHTFNELVDARRQVVVAGDLPPSELNRLDTRMRSRLTGGLVTHIANPDYAQRKAILEEKIKDMRALKPDFCLPEETVAFIARRIEGSGREMVGALNRLAAMWDLAQGQVTPELAARAIRDMVAGQSPEQVRIDDIHRAVIDHFKITKAELLSTRRHRSIARPRQIAMFLAKELTTRSLPEIGRRFGGKDHTTVLYAVRRIKTLMKDDSELVRIVEVLKRSLGG